MAALCHAVMILALLGLELTYPLGKIFLVGIAAVAVLLFYEHALVRPTDLTRVNLAFFHVNVIISMGLLVFGLADLVF
jgi:4-hydroxybenzoate polyprenyltransferase